ncbi:uncharacterized protein [Malus domestica]|uniref:uncharacterized protein n=1 Tax=Malus domestica TaxID=3750 RepID=UPI0039763A6C
MWHLKLGHVNLDKIRKMSKDGYFRPLGNDKMGTGEYCLKGKMTKSPFTGKGKRSTEILRLIITDICGAMSTTSRGGFSYYITFTSDHSQFGYVYLMKYKSKSFEKFKELKNEVEKQTGKQIKILRSNRGGEYLSTRQVDNPVPEPLAPRRSERVSKPPKRHGFDNEFGELHRLGDNDTKEDPRDYTEAMSDINSKRWKEAMKSEMESMQQEGINYEETFFPVAMIKSIRILVAIVVYHDYEIWQMDVKTAFLNGYLEEELYMTQPKGFVPKSEKTKMKDFGDASYVLGIKLYRDRSRKLNGLSQSMHIDKDVKGVNFPHDDALVISVQLTNAIIDRIIVGTGYNPIAMHKPDKEKTTFVIEGGTYYYKVMPFGLKNAGATYLLLSILTPYSNKGSGVGGLHS